MGVERNRRGEGGRALEAQDGFDAGRRRPVAPRMAGADGV